MKQKAGTIGEMGNQESPNDGKSFCDGALNKKLVSFASADSTQPTGAGEKRNQVILDLEEDELSGEIAISEDHKRICFCVPSD